MGIVKLFLRHFSVWRTAWQIETVHAVPTPRGKAVEFLPAVLEIQDAPPSPIGRSILWTIVVLFLTVVGWSGLGWIDIVAIAPGKIIPSGHSKTIQPFETGVVAAIYVQDGQVVKKGQILIELDATQNRADRDRSTNEYRAALVDVARLRALIAGQATFLPPPEADQAYGALQQQFLRDQLAEYEARLEASFQLIEQRNAAIDSTRENIRRLEETVPMEAERAAAYKKLFDQQYVSKMDYLQFEQQRIDKAQELAGQKGKLRQDRAALAEAEKNHRALVSEFQQSNQAELAVTETKANSLLQEVRKAG
ncbi:MAG: biotin/lipoyl-binding protein, partial [Nitrospiraceae bacterium]